MSALTESPMHICEIDDYGVPHPPAWGRFRRRRTDPRHRDVAEREGAHLDA